MRAEYDPRREGYRAAQKRRERAVEIAANTNGYERLRELVGAEHFPEFHACICGIAYAIADRIADRIEPGSEYDHLPQREALRQVAEDLDGQSERSVSSEVGPSDESSIGPKGGRVTSEEVATPTEEGVYIVRWDRRDGRTVPNCYDCGVAPGESHRDGCDIARCTACGFQRISCDHDDSDEGWGHVWTGRWPGDVEVEEGLASDLNDLHRRAATGLLYWDGTRWRT